MECQGDKCSELHRRASGGCTCLRLAAHGAEIIETENITRRYRGWYDPETQSVVVRADLPWPKKHSTLAHELAHVELGDAHRPTWWGAVREDDMEADADELAARDLIPLWRLAGVLQDAQAAEDAAAQLDVDARMVRARLASLTAVERRFLDHATQPLPRRRVTLERMSGRVVLADRETDQPATRLRDVQMTARRILATAEPPASEPEPEPRTPSRRPGAAARVFTARKTITLDPDPEPICSHLASPSTGV